ncbi:HepT-like ribonuclease domain-containing protein [Albibacterium profundi]|uniref:DUF86 domain-containing protein n=1 Tax=Albibacterium profundi TaxID=3134906 RepID=A0ABV5CCU8_9SPHI
MKSELGDKVRLLHILDAINSVERYILHVFYNEFLENSEKRFATVKQIEIIGEACNALSEKLKTEHSDIPWKAIKGFRNVSIHEYFGVDFHVVWEIATHDLPDLKVKIQGILENIEKTK